ncbi:MAG: short-chain fatty acyl-CoA regulator family protein [Amaricoccus sp.]|uniref:short-chain fatty acyl-CoA regulator family protein n=1 Tax=Amaricoccus sp. TaxID=1872485 RepID=UPI0039E45205
MPRAFLGPRIRERRRGLGVTQADLARQIGISPSYLNLIERNKRTIAGPLLRRTAQALGIGLEDLDGAAERRLLATLSELANAPDLASLGVEAAAAGELIGRYPGWARAVAALARAERSATAEARALADRLTHDPILAETVHMILSRIAAIRSAAEILADYADVPPEQRDRFLGIIADESLALSHGGAALSEYFDATAADGRRLSPFDEVAAIFERREEHFEEIEAAAASAPGPEEHSVEAARGAALTRCGGPIATIVAAAPEIGTPAAERLRAALVDYAAAALLLPMVAFAPKAAELGHDAEALADVFGVDVSTVCRRLVTLREGPRFGYLRVNAAGSLLERRGLPGLFAPRYAAACPLWVLYRAQQSPETMIRQLAVFPTGDRFVFVARAGSVGPSGFGRPRHYLTDMLAMSESDARRTVYAPDAGARAEEVGPACRICSRAACPHRVDDALG